MRKLLSCMALGALFSASSLSAAQPAPAQPAPGKAAPTKAPAKAPAAAQPPAAAPAQPTQPAPAQPAPTGAGAQTDAAAAGAQQPPPDDAPLMPPPPAKPANPDPDKDAAALVKQGAARPTDEPPPGAPKPADKPGPKPAAAGDIGAKPGDVYAEDWWSHARPTFEFHGYFRVRSELMDHFALGRPDVPGRTLWPQPGDNEYEDLQGTRNNLTLCGNDPENPEPCSNNTQAGANMRFRLNPELHISDNLRVMAQIDMLDNLVLGSTPEGYANEPSADGGYRVTERGGYAPLGAFSSTQWAPQSGVNSQRDSITVKRVWAEYMTPVGVLRFGRMPSHWGLGILANGGDGHDSDWQSTADRLMFVTGIKKYDVYFAAAWDFANEGAISQPLNEQQGQPYDIAQKDDVSQYVFAAVRRRSPELQKLELAKGQFVLNGGAYFVYRNQELDNITTDASGASLGNSNNNVKSGYVRRRAEAFIPDLWVQFLYEKFRFEAEAALIIGSIENLQRSPNGGVSDYKNDFDPENKGWKIAQFGLAAEADYKALEDKLKVGLGFGYSSGDKDVENLAPPARGLQPQATTDRNFTTFRFHPDYRVDLILFRNILSRVQGAYYLRPNVSYDFTRDKNGQRIGGNAALIWSRASEFIQTPGHQPDLGVELNFGLYYQAKDGTLNDDPDKLGGFFTSLQYGVLFPLGGFGYLSQEKTLNPDLSNQTAQMVRWYLGVLF